MDKYSISLAKLIKEFSLDVIHLPREADDIIITSPEVDRPGLALSGFFEYFKTDRIKLIGNAEYRYLSLLGDAERLRCVSDFLEKKPVAVIIAAGHRPFDEIIEKSKEYGVPLLRTDASTSAIIAELIASLNVHLAPRVTRHGVLVEVYGEGMLILGDSGIGKRETAIELVKRDISHTEAVRACSVLKEQETLARPFTELLLTQI